jgi:hypothetical protein
MTWREASLAVSLAVLWGCAGEDEMAGRDVAASARDVDASAAEDRAPRSEGDIGGTFGPEVHMLVTDIAAHLICDRIDGAFLPLGSEEGQPASGHLWVRGCVARRERKVAGREGERCVQGKTSASGPSWFELLLDSFSEESRLNVYAVRIEVRPPPAPS